MSDNPRPDPTPIQVICLGLSRAGTTSMSEALDILGFGPCYHILEILKKGINNFPVWFRISDGSGTAKDLDALLRNYHSVLDQPPALLGPELYAAYPNAKYILTTRDPAKWEKSMKDTLFLRMNLLATKTSRSLIEESLFIWSEKYMAKYHRNRLLTHTQQELLDHNERVMGIIPKEKLLVYEAGEGWDRLAESLGVPKPEIPFPHLNNATQFNRSAKIVRANL